jgi:hypothetical protein
VLLLAVVFVGGAYHVHDADRSEGMAVIAVSGDLAVGVHAQDGSPAKDDRHDKSACQACTVAAQLIAPPAFGLLTITAQPCDPYRRVSVERTGLAPPSLNRPPISAYA